MIFALAFALFGADLSYDDTARVTYVNEALTAVRAAEPRLLRSMFDYVRALNGSACRSPIERLRTECLIAGARRRCKTVGEPCTSWADVVVASALAERHFVSTEQRHALMRRHKDFRKELAKELLRQQAGLALDFHLAAGRSCAARDDDCLAEQLDDYCMRAADEQNLSWQRCVATLVWFIGTGAEL